MVKTLTYSEVAPPWRQAALCKASLWALQSFWGDVKPNIFLDVLRSHLAKMLVAMGDRDKDVADIATLSVLEVSISPTSHTFKCRLRGLGVKDISVDYTSVPRSYIQSRDISDFFHLPVSDFLTEMPLKQSVVTRELSAVDLSLVTAADFEAWKGRLGSDYREENWGFWLNWFRGVVLGQPMSEALMKRVVQIDEPFWIAGPEAVATEIARIEAEFRDRAEGVEPRQEAFEPKSVKNLLKNNVIVAAQSQNLAVNISEAFERFAQETGINHVPETFASLEAMPRSLEGISLMLRQKVQTPESEQKLREEIGRLNAKVAWLEKDLAEARSASPPVFAEAFRKQAASSLGDWKLYAALCGGIWLVSGDEVGMQKRLENIMVMRDALFGDVSPVPGPEPVLPNNPVVDL